MKAFSRTLFAAYLIILLWLLLFKFSYDPIGVIRDFQTRSVNLVPFTRAYNSEMIANLIAFIPFGVMLGVVFKKMAFGYKLAAIFAFSLGVELIQYGLAIGVTDVTDVIMNTLGGFAGLAVYAAIGRDTNDNYFDRMILVAGTLMLLMVVYLRVFVFMVRY